MKEALKRLAKLSPIPLSKNHRYDLQTKKIINQLSNDSNCIDVGCYKGEILDLMIRSAPKGIHYGVEPIPQQYKYLELKYKNVLNCKLLNFAASDKSGVSSFNYVTSNPPYSGLRKRDYDKDNEKDESIDVRTELLDNLIPLDLKIDLIKIDVEGAELLVLEGASKIILKHKPLIIFEHGLGASNHYGNGPKEMFTYFEGKGMNISSLTNFLKGRSAFTLEQFEEQYNNRKNYYFIAHLLKEEQ